MRPRGLGGKPSSIPDWLGENGLTSLSPRRVSFPLQWKVPSVLMKIEKVNPHKCSSCLRAKISTGHQHVSGLWRCRARCRVTVWSVFKGNAKNLFQDFQNHLPAWRLEKVDSEETGGFCGKEALDVNQAAVPASHLQCSPVAGAWWPGVWEVGGGLTGCSGVGGLLQPHQDQAAWHARPETLWDEERVCVSSWTRVSPAVDRAYNPRLSRVPCRATPGAKC